MTKDGSNALLEFTGLERVEGQTPQNLIYVKIDQDTLLYSFSGVFLSHAFYISFPQRFLYCKAPL